MTHKTGIAPLKDSSGNLVVNDSTKATLLNEHFVRAGTVDNGIIPPFDTPVSCDLGIMSNVTISSVYFSSNDICKIITNLNDNSAPGPDGIGSKLLKNLKHVLSFPLALMFNLIFQFSSVPDDWKQAIVKPIFKKGNSCDLNNYRPISLTSVISKLFESIVKDAMVTHFTENFLISKHQHGFIAKHSTCTNMLECLNDWTLSHDKKFLTKILYVDFCKAFDSVSIPKLLFKLSKYGVSGALYDCIKSFLTSRVQKVKVGEAISSSLSLTSGVAQGSVLGPFLFLIYINDLPDLFENDVISKLYADDLKSYNTYDYRVNPSKTESSLKLISDWAETWQLKLSIQKCGSLLLKGKNNYLDTQDLFITDDLLSVLESVKDLGILVDSQLSFTPHIDSVIARAKQRIYLIFKSFKSRTIKMLMTAYKTYILPILDYCSSVWSPRKLSDIDNLENVQRYFTKRLHKLWHSSYAERLIKCNIVSLEKRRLITDLILCFKIINNVIELKFEDFFTFDKYNKTRGHNLKLRLPLHKTSIRQNFFSVRVVPVWNSLPSSIVNSTSLNLFKAGLEGLDLSSHLYRNF
jgi:hypothetical protein